MKKKKMYSTWFLLPAMIVFLIIFIIPTVTSFFFSMTVWDFQTYRFIGFDNFKMFLTERSLNIGIKNTLIYAVIMVLGSNLLGLVLAMALNVKLRGKAFFRTASYVPALFSAIVVGFIWSYVYMPESGMIASLMNTLTVPASMFLEITRQLCMPSPLWKCGRHSEQL